MEHLKRLVRYFAMDMVSTIFFFVLIGLFVYFISGGKEADNVGYFLSICALYVFKCIIWQGGYVDQLRDYRNMIQEKENEIRMYQMRNGELGKEIKTLKAKK